MKLFMTIMAVLLAVLSIAAGIPKLFEMPQEVELLQNIGFDGFLVPLLGTIQIVGGILFVWPQARMAGSALVVTGFSISSLALFISGNLVFASFSVVPLVLAIAVAFKMSRGQRVPPGDSADT